jgi:hypothetical protein
MYAGNHLVRIRSYHRAALLHEPRRANDASAPQTEEVAMPSEKLKKAEHRQGTKICKWWRDGSVSIEWIDQQSGEKVVGDFIQVGPTQSSAEFAARTDRMLRSAAALSHYLRRVP